MAKKATSLFRPLPQLIESPHAHKHTDTHASTHMHMTLSAQHNSMQHLHIYTFAMLRTSVAPDVPSTGLRYKYNRLAYLFMHITSGLHRNMHKHQ